MIYKFQPFSTTKNLGEEYNQHCKLVPRDDDWILILDYDAMILTPKTYQVIEKAIQNKPDTEIFGAMTNRVGYSFQRIHDKLDDDSDIRNHIKIAEQMAVRFPAGECKDVKSVAGFFMLFRKSYWKKHPFQEKIIDNLGHFFDYNFCRPAHKAGLPIRVIRGAYVWHSYRLMKDPRNKEHLKI